jgi:hypothetical protein
MAITGYYRLLFSKLGARSDWYADQADKAERFSYDPIKIKIEAPIAAIPHSQ